MAEVEKTPETKAEVEKAPETKVEVEKAADTKEVTDKEEAPPKEEIPPKVILHQFPPVKFIPNASPFCLKLETFLRINKIPYENQYGYKMGKNGKIPWIEYKGDVKADSNLIINYLNDKFEIDLNKVFTSEQLSLGRSTRVMLEENTYWALVYNRYVDNFNEYKNLITPPSGGGIGFTVSQKMFQRKMRGSLDGHGLGRHAKEDLYAIAEKDLKAVSVSLGEKLYLLGDSPSSFDCAVFGFCANVLYSGLESPMATYIKEHATNLSKYCERMRETYWKDWEDIVVGEIAEPRLKKGFSFRKKQSKTTTKKEPEKESKDAPAEDVAVENITSGEKGVESIPLSEAAAE